MEHEKRYPAGNWKPQERDSLVLRALLAEPVLNITVCCCENIRMALIDAEREANGG